MHQTLVSLIDEIPFQCKGVVAEVDFEKILNNFSSTSQSTPHLEAYEQEIRSLLASVQSKAKKEKIPFTHSIPKDATSVDWARTTVDVAASILVLLLAHTLNQKRQAAITQDGAFPIVLQ